MITGVFALFLILCTAPAVAVTHEHESGDHGIDGAWIPINSEADLPTTTSSGNYYLNADIDLTNTWEIKGTINLCLNGFVIKQTGSGSVISIKDAGSQLNLYDCGTEKHYFDINEETGLWTLNDEHTSSPHNVTGGVITGGTRSGDGGGVYIYNSISNSIVFNMYGGNIVGNSASVNGGGVYVYESGGLKMSGGNITGNTAKTNGGGVDTFGIFMMSGGNITENTAPYGGGVYIYGGSFTMSGGNISKNDASGELGQGGGVCNFIGSFRMSGGNITHNSAGDEGGGVYLIYYQFEMSGGNITDNTGQRGGGVSNLEGTFIMRGGNISKNTGTVEGGGVFNLRNTFEMHGGNITENTAPYGGGVYDDGYFNMYGGNITANTADMGGGVGSIYDKNGEGLGSPFIMYNGNITDNIAKSGGGVHYDGPEFKMYNGNITGNKATGFENEEEYVGGGVFVSNGGEAEGGAFTMLGGNITDNIATDNYEDNFFGGVYSDGMITLSGKITITGNKVNGVVENLFLLEDETITIGEGGLLPGSSIGVTTEIKPEEDSPVYVTETTVFAESNTEYFHADKSTEEIQFDEDNYKIVLTKKPTPPPVPTLPGNGDLNVTYDNTQRYTVVIPGDMDFAGRLTIDNDARVIEMWLEINSVLNVSVKSENGFEMIHGDPAISRIPYEMSVDGGEPLEGTGFNVIMSVPANTPKDIDLGYFVKKDLWYEVTQSDIDAAKFAGEHKDTLTFKVEVEVASA